VGPADRDHRDSFGHEVAAAAPSEPLDRDPIALPLDEDDGPHGEWLNGVLLGREPDGAIIPA
jgi:hypothetical protein